MPFVSIVAIVFFSIHGKILSKKNDWLVTPLKDPVTFFQFFEESGCLLGFFCYSLSNGLVSRHFVLSKNGGWATMDIFSNMKEESSIRALSPEGNITLNGLEYSIGGLKQTTQAAYWNSTDLSSPGGITELQRSISFRYLCHETLPPSAQYDWTPGTRHSPKDANWPPTGLHLAVTFGCESLPELRLEVHYEMYVGIPVMSKWISLHRGNMSEKISNHRYDPNLRGHQYTPQTKYRLLKDPRTLRIDDVIVEVLSTNREYSPQATMGLSLLSISTDQPHGTRVLWKVDERIERSPGSVQPFVVVDHNGNGPGVTLDPLGSDYVSFRVLILMYDSVDPERMSLSERRMRRTLTPQIMESPLFFHLTNSSAGYLANAVDQLHLVEGFDMLIFSFGSGFVMETYNKTYISRIATEVDYARSRGIEVGGYDLICLDRGYRGYGGNVNDSWDRILPTGKLGPDACFASGWIDKLKGYVDGFLEEAGLTMMEADGPWGGSDCWSRKHVHHMDVFDSVYHQERLQGTFFTHLDLAAKNVFINQPDGYFYAGANKSPMGYNEMQFSLPRWEDLTITRAHTVYDQTYFNPPTMGWSFVPIVRYHKGGASEEEEAAFVPLGKHLKAYEFALAQHIGAGIAACYRGPIIFDDNESLALVKKWTSFWMKYRSILTKDIIHLRRANGRGIDAFMHVDGEKKEALVMAFNSQTEVAVKGVELRVELYYAGISDTALVSHEGDSSVEHILVERDYSIPIKVNLEPESLSWWYITSL